MCSNGEFYACSKHGHSEIARQFNTTDRWLEQAGWIKISQSVDKIYVFSRVEPNEAQKITLSEWAQQFGHDEEFKGYVEMWSDI